MPMIVVTLTNVPLSLRGDLTKWLQEISTGVYVGNINSRVRDELWKRIIDNIKQGQATMSYSKRNEIGYDFMVHNTNKEVINCDGIPIVFLPVKSSTSQLLQPGFSNAAKYQKIAKVRRAKAVTKRTFPEGFAVIDVETTGIDDKKDKIIEIAAVKTQKGEMIAFKSLIKIQRQLPRSISELTRITNDMLESDGRDISVVLDEFISFIKDLTLIGYNVKFDIGFINAELKNNNKERLSNKAICLLEQVKRKNKFLRDYRLSTVLKEYGLCTEGLHRAYIDVMAEYELAMKLNIFQ